MGKVKGIIAIKGTCNHEGCTKKKWVQEFCYVHSDVICIFEGCKNKARNNTLTCKKHGTKRINKTGEKWQCKVHGYVDPKYIKQYTLKIRPGEVFHKCRICTTKNRDEERKKIKLKAQEYKGGKCLKCGYNKCIAALEFHHRDPTQKEFTISLSKICSWNQIKPELDKCDLLCANCHKETHYEMQNNKL